MHSKITQTYQNTWEYIIKSVDNWLFNYNKRKKKEKKDKLTFSEFIEKFSKILEHFGSLLKNRLNGLKIKGKKGYIKLLSYILCRHLDHLSYMSLHQLLNFLW